MSRETEFAAGRHSGMSPGAKEYLEKEEATMEWWAVDRVTGKRVRGTKAQLLAGEGKPDPRG